MENVQLSLQQAKALTEPCDAKVLARLNAFALRGSKVNSLWQETNPLQSRLHSWSSLGEVGDPLKYLKPPASCDEEHIVFWVFSFHPTPAGWL